MSAVSLGSIDLSDQRLQYGRPRRDFGNLDVRSEFLRHRRYRVADAFSDVVTLKVALFFAHEIDLDVSLVGRAAQIVVTHEAVEVVGRCGAGVGL